MIRQIKIALVLFLGTTACSNPVDPDPPPCPPGTSLAGPEVPLCSGIGGLRVCCIPHSEEE